MKKTFMTAILAGLMAVSMSMTAFAGQWQQDAKGWWYQNDDGTYLKDGWKWVDGKCYYFTSDGYCLTGTQTPDGYTVDASGAWIVDGGVQLQFNLEENAGNDEEDGENSGEASYEYDAYDLIGTYTSEDGDYMELNLGIDDSLVGMYYDEDGSFDGIYSFKKVNSMEYADSPMRAPLP